VKDSEVIEELVSALTDESEPSGGLISCELLGEGWFVTEGSTIVGTNNGFELVSSDGSVHRIFSIRIR